MGILKSICIALFTGVVVSSTGCTPEDDGPENYHITYQVSGSSLNQIYFRSTQQDFDIPIVPTEHWAAANVLLGSDTIMLYGSQTTPDTITPVIVTLIVEHEGYSPVTYSDTNTTATSVTAILPY